ncbi:SRPBCC family protein [Methylobrevis pamukkalensis]|uniref:Carbon monoxide dehydrogenase subunit G (CoxG) n=1 Tax=Methylobrevis pamukkalensis TaxID=1439726 RepID=A0A1E3H7B8_9HYPH|nr:carbon monoxide dehydrogenase subunit G [Methylobrevis pamukkalensis]ODN72229.1 Carbon monoxide dehydrogenase subunit G (CoxG) [Methylobrevis pamukkalensis]
MDMTGEYRIPASRDAVWAALNDPDTLKACIPGCESLERDGEALVAAVVAKIGPVKAKFAGKVTFEDVDPPNGYTISGEGSGGVAGFAKGGAAVRLAEDGADTILTYTAKAQVGGKLAQLGSRLIDSTARKMADDFFGAFSAKVGGDAAVAAEAAPIAAAPVSADPVMATPVTGVPVTPADETPVEHAIHVVADAEKRAEEAVETAAIRSGPAGPMMWGLIALGVVVVLLLVTQL